jgi:hypothetical protein
MSRCDGGDFVVAAKPSKPRGEAADRRPAASGALFVWGVCGVGLCGVRSVILNGAARFKITDLTLDMKAATRGSPFSIVLDAVQSVYSIAMPLKSTALLGVLIDRLQMRPLRCQVCNLAVSGL